MSSTGIVNVPDSISGADDLQLDFNSEYCARWLAEVAAARQQQEQSSRITQLPPSPGYQPHDSILDQYSTSSVPGTPPIQAAQIPESATQQRVAQSPGTCPIEGTTEPGPGRRADREAEYSPPAQAYEGTRYNRRPRRKTRPDRYDTTRERRRSTRERTGLTRHERRERKREKLRSRREVMNNFYSEAVGKRHLLMKPALATGAFVNGRGSSSTPLTDLTFNELTFPVPQKRRQPSRQRRSNGARKRTDSETCQPAAHEENMDAIEVPLPSDLLPGSPSPLRLQLPTENMLDTTRTHNRTEHTNDENVDPVPIIQYVDCGIDPVSDHDHEGLSNNQIESVAIPRQPLPTTTTRDTEASNVDYEAHSMFAACVPQLYELNMSAGGFPEYATEWSQPVPVDGEMQQCPTQIYDGYVSNLGSFELGYEPTPPILSMQPAIANDAAGYGSPEPVHYTPPHHYGPDEGTRAFWRPNFLR